MNNHFTTKEFHCVIDVRTKGRVSQWYSRKGDAIRKSSRLNNDYGLGQWTAAVTCKITDIELCEDK